MQDFIVKLGQSKAERLQSEFTMIHNETAYQIIQQVGPEGFALYYTLSSLAFGKTNVVLNGKATENKELQQLLGKSERTIQRWKEKLAEAKLIRVVRCQNPKGMQVSNVIIFNAAWPEIPEGWDDYAPNGFVQITEGQAPILHEEYEQLVTQGVSLFQRKKKQNSSPVKFDTPGVSKVTPLPRAI